MDNVIRSPVCGADHTPWETPMIRPLVFWCSPGESRGGAARPLALPSCPAALWHKLGPWNVLTWGFILGGRCLGQLRASFWPLSRPQLPSGQLCPPLHVHLSAGAVTDWSRAFFLGHHGPALTGLLVLRGLGKASNLRRRVPELPPRSLSSPPALPQESPLGSHMQRGRCVQVSSLQLSGPPGHGCWWLAACHLAGLEDQVCACPRPPRL